MIKLTKRELRIRNEIIAELWSERKSEITMLELARMFRLDGSRVYQILRGGRDEEKIAKGELYKLDHKINKVLDNNK